MLICLSVPVSLYLSFSFSLSQLDHARLTQTELMKEKFSYDQQIADLLLKQEELQQRLEEERTAREKLTLELHHAEGVCVCGEISVFMVCLQSCALSDNPYCVQ